MSLLEIQEEYVKDEQKNLKIELLRAQETAALLAPGAHLPLTPCAGPPASQFGFEGPTACVDGLWERPLGEFLDFVASSAAH